MRGHWRQTPFIPPLKLSQGRNERGASPFAHNVSINYICHGARTSFVRCLIQRSDRTTGAPYAARTPSSRPHSYRTTSPPSTIVPCTVLVCKSECYFPGASSSFFFLLVIRLARWPVYDHSGRRTCLTSTRSIWTIGQRPTPSPTISPILRPGQI